MHPASNRVLSSCVAALLLIGGLLMALRPAAAPALGTDRISMRVEVYGLMGLHVLTLNTSVEEVGERYAINTHYKTTGVAGLVVDQQTRATASGRLIPASAQAESFHSDTRLNCVARQVYVIIHFYGLVGGRGSTATREC